MFRGQYALVHVITDRLSPTATLKTLCESAAHVCGAPLLMYVNDDAYTKVLSPVPNNGWQKTDGLFQRHSPARIKGLRMHDSIQLLFLSRTDLDSLA